jgi:oligopeptide transport system substrate-binding protein
MKKNLLLFLSILLIVSMFLSVAYVALSEKSEIAEEINYHETVKKNLQVNIGTEPLTLHPGLATDSVSETVILQLFEGLTRKDLWGQTVNAAATIIKISDDQKTYTFTIRDSKWSNGDSVTAMDFEYAWKWILDPENNSPNAYQLYYLEGAQEFNNGKGNMQDVGVIALDDQTLEVKLTQPTPNFLNIIALPTFFPINSKIAEKHSNWAEGTYKYTTNGSFHLIEWDHNNKIVLERSKNYWDADMVELSRISMLMVNDPKRELSLYENGTLNLLTAPIETMIMDDEPFYTQAIAGAYTIKLNTNIEPFNNKNIRKALGLAINRHGIINNIMKNGTVPAMAIVHPMFFPENKNGYFKDNDVIRAKKYLQTGLEELGYKDVSELPVIKLSVNTEEMHKNVAENIQKMWLENLGVKVTIESSKGSKHYEKHETLNYEGILMESLSSYREPVSSIEMYIDSNITDQGTESENNSLYNLLGQSYLETNTIERKELLRKVEALLVEEMPMIPICFFTIEVIQSEKVTNVAYPHPGQVQFKWTNIE